MAGAECFGKKMISKWKKSQKNILAFLITKMFSASQRPWPSKQNFNLIKFYCRVKVGVRVIFVDISSKCSENTAPIFSKQLGFPLLPQCLRSVNKPRHELQVQSPKLKPDESQQIYCPLKLCVTDKGLTQTLICDCTLLLFYVPTGTRATR